MRQSVTVQSVAAMQLDIAALQAQVASLSTPESELAALGATWIFDPLQCRVIGGKVVTALDAAGGASYLTSDSGKEFTLDTTGPYGAVVPSLRTNNTSGALTAPTGGVTGNQPFHIALIGRSNAEALVQGYNAVAGFGAPAASNINIGIDAANRSWYAFRNGGPELRYERVGASALDARIGHDYIVELQYDGITLSLWLDGKHYAATDTAVAMGIADASFGFRSWWTGNYPVNDARIDAAMFCAGKVLTRAGFAKWLNHEFRRLGGTAIALNCNGDSTTEGGATGTTPAAYLPVAIRNQANGSTVIYPQNSGKSSLRSDELLIQKVLTYSDFATHEIFWWGVNDTNQDVPAATQYASTYAAVRRAKALGRKTIVMTLQQWAALTSNPTRDANRLARNQFDLANVAGADVVVDTAKIMGPYNPALFGDGLHPNDFAITTLIAPAVYQALKGLQS